jgi:hypothetical protein
LIVPPNVAGGGGIRRPSMVVVASGEPGVPITSCADATCKEALTINPIIAARYLRMVASRNRILYSSATPAV